ncbi:MAG: DUF3501 family protein [Gammaproteobacteria bacterium]
MDKLNREDLYSLETYAAKRPEFRGRVLEHKKHRRLGVGPNATLIFEDRLTIQYQIQEMLRVERIFEAAGIQDELDAYNPLIPDGSNWKASFLIEFENPGDRREALAKLVGIEDRTWVQVNGHERVFAVADEDLERDNAEKTSAVHFMRFELTPEMAEALKGGAELSVGIDHDEYRHEVSPVPDAIRESLARDLD